MVKHLEKNITQAKLLATAVAEKPRFRAYISHICSWGILANFLQAFIFLLHCQILSTEQNFVAIITDIFPIMILCTKIKKLLCTEVWTRQIGFYLVGPSFI